MTKRNYGQNGDCGPSSVKTDERATSGLAAEAISKDGTLDELAKLGSRGVATVQTRKL